MREPKMISHNDVMQTRLVDPHRRGQSNSLELSINDGAMVNADGHIAVDGTVSVYNMIVHPTPANYELLKKFLDLSMTLQIAGRPRPASSPINSILYYDADADTQRDLVSEAIQRFTIPGLREKSLGPRQRLSGRVLALIYSRASPGLRRKIDSLVVSPAHKEFLKKLITDVDSIVESTLGISSAPDVSTIPGKIKAFAGRVRKTRSRTYKYARRTRRKH